MSDIDEASASILALAEEAETAAAAGTATLLAAAEAVAVDQAQQESAVAPVPVVAEEKPPILVLEAGGELDLDPFSQSHDENNTDVFKESGDNTDVSLKSKEDLDGISRDIIMITEPGPAEQTAVNQGQEAEIDANQISLENSDQQETNGATGPIIDPIFDIFGPAGLLQEGTEFDSFESFTVTLQQYSDATHVQFACNDSSSLDCRPNKDRYNPKIVYSHITFTCTFGGKQLPSRSSGIRKTTSRKTGCPVRIKLAATPDGQRLVIKDSKLDCHNHDIIPDDRLRHLDEETELEIYNLISMHENKRLARMLVRDKLVKETGKEILMKDINNIEKRVENKLKKLNPKAATASQESTEPESQLLEEGNDTSLNDNSVENVGIDAKEFEGEPETTSDTATQENEEPTKKTQTPKSTEPKKPKKFIAIRPSPLPASQKVKEEQIRKIVTEKKVQPPPKDPVPKQKRTVVRQPGPKKTIAVRPTKTYSEKQVRKSLSSKPINVADAKQDKTPMKKEKTPVTDSKKETPSVSNNKRRASLSDSNAPSPKRSKRTIKEPKRFMDQDDFGITTDIRINKTEPPVYLDNDKIKSEKEKALIIKSPRVSLSRVKVEGPGYVVTPREVRSNKRKLSIEQQRKEEEEKEEEERQQEESEPEPEQESEPEFEPDESSQEVYEEIEEDMDRRSEIRERKLAIQEEMLMLERRKISMLEEMNEKLDQILENQLIIQENR